MGKKRWRKTLRGHPLLPEHIDRRLWPTTRPTPPTATVANPHPVVMLGYFLLFWCMRFFWCFSYKDETSCTEFPHAPKSATLTWTATLTRASSTTNPHAPALMHQASCTKPHAPPPTHLIIRTARLCSPSSSSCELLTTLVVTGRLSRRSRHFTNPPGANMQSTASSPYR